jgi:WD40 repeat protein
MKARPRITTALFLAVLMSEFLAAPAARSHAAYAAGTAGRTSRETDCYGDPLPNGAVSRVGTCRLWLGSRINSIVFAATGNTFAATAAGSSRAVPIWDAETGRLIRALPAPEDALPPDCGVRQVAFSPDGERLAGACDDGAIRIWKVGSGRSLQVLRGHSGFVASVSFSPDGKTVASSGEDGTIRVWNLARGDEVREFSSPRHFGGSPIFSPDGATLIAGWSARGNAATEFVPYIRTYAVATGNEIVRFSYQGWLPRNYLAPDGRTIASLDSDGVIRIWELASGRMVREVGLDQRDVSGGAFAPGRTTLASRGADASIRLFDVATGKQTRRIPTDPRSIVHPLAFSPKGRTIASASGSGTVVQLHDVATGDDKLPHTRHLGPIRSIAPAPDGKTIVSAGADSTIRIWDLASGKEVRRLLDAPPASWFAGQRDHGAALAALQSRVGPPGSLVFSADHRTITALGRDGTMTRWDATGGQELLRLQLAGIELVETTAFSPDGKLIGYAGNDDVVTIRDTVSGKEMSHRAVGNGAQIRALAFSPDGTKLASSGDGGVVTILEANTLRSVQSVRASSESIQSVVFSPDAETLCMGGLDGIMRLWRPRTGEIQRSPPWDDPDDHIIRTVAFSPDGALLASGGDDRTVRVWDAATLRVSRELQGHQDGINQITFSRGSRALFSCSDDGTILGWELGPRKGE